MKPGNWIPQQRKRKPQRGWKTRRVWKKIVVGNNYCPKPISRGIKPSKSHMV
jgi:hypothetical protein